MNDLRQLLTLDINGRTVGAQQGDTLCHVKNLMTFVPNDFIQ